MIPEHVKKILKKQHYGIVGKHSAVQICRWTKRGIKDEGSCYKQKFYGIKSHKCCQMTPNMWCPNSCKHCWRAIEFTTGKEMPEGMPLIIKLNSNDYTPKDGITPVLATRYAKWLYEAGIDGIEISAGTVTYSFMNMCRGETPVDEMVLGLPWWKKPLGRMMLNQLKGKFDLVEGYNVNAAELIKPEINGVPLITVGGFRRLTHMQEVIEKGTTDFISLCRPLIREPKLVVDFKEGKKDLVACESCNRCLAAVALNLPVRCYTKGFDNKN